MRTKWAFWGTLAVVLALCAIPSVVWLGALRDYYQFLTGFEPRPLKPSKSNRIPHSLSQESGSDNGSLIFVEFSFKAPSAKNVSLNGDFTRWSAVLALTRQPQGYWEVMVPLPPGRYRYHFLVDGVETLDPSAPTEDLKEGRKASLRAVAQGE